MNTSKKETYTTLFGEELRFPEPPPEVSAFLVRLRKFVNDPQVSELDMLNLLYGKENPLLDQTIFETRGAVTVVVFKNPVYHVMLDLLGQKAIQAGTLDPKKAEAAFSMTVPEASAQLGIHQSAVRQAIHAHKLAAIKKGGQYLLEPDSVGAYRVSRRGPQKGAARNRAPHPHGQQAGPSAK